MATTKKKSVKKQAKPALKSSSKSSTKSRRQPQTMKDLLAQTGYQLRGFKRGDLVEATLVEKTKRALYFDIGGKTEGMVIDREMKAARGFIKTLEVWHEVFDSIL